MSSQVLLFLFQSLLTVAAPFALWRLPPLRRTVPLVVVQIGLGVALGPTLLGRLAPDLSARLFPAESLAVWRGLVWLAVLLFGFLTGLHFDAAALRHHRRGFVLTSLASVAVPTVLGTAAGAWVAAALPQALGPSAQPWGFALGMGMAAGVTALPVLGAILRELDMPRHPAGAMALGCAAVNDAALWVLAAAVLALQSGRGVGDSLLMLAGIAAWGAVLWWGVRPLLRGLLRQGLAEGRLDQRELVAVCSLLLLSAIATEALGVHAILGAFAFGAVMPRAAAADLLRRLESVVGVLLMPFFFLSTGLLTRFDPARPGVLAIFGVMTAVAVLGKLAGTALPLRLSGMDGRNALITGAFMQCKGLMEVVVLTMLREAGLISDLCFSAMIGMALATTALTKPLVGLLRRGEPAEVSAE